MFSLKNEKEAFVMKRWTAALLALMLLLMCAALAEACEGWAVATVNTRVRDIPDAQGRVVLEVHAGEELEYGGFTKYDDAHNPWYGVTWSDGSGWIPGSDAELKWSTLY